MAIFTVMFKMSKIALVFIAVVFIFSCRKDFNRPNWDVDLLAPLAKTSLSIKNLFPDSVIQVESDTSLKLVYQTNIFDIEMDSLFRIPDTVVSANYVFPLSIFVAPGNSLYVDNDEFVLDVSNGVELNTVLIESGFIEVEIFSEIREKVVINYTIPSATKNGDTLVLTELVDAATNFQDGYFKKIIDVSGYKLDLRGTSLTEVNTLVTRASVGVDPNAASSVTVFAGDKITYSSSLVDVVPFYVKGYLGSQQYRFGPETTTMNIFDKVLSGSVDIDQVDVNLDFENGIGVDAQLTIDQLSSINTVNNTSKLLTHAVVGTPINLNRAQETFSIPEVTYSNYNVFMNTTNSNIDELIEIIPNQLLYDINLNINPLGNLSGNNDFVFKKHPLRVKLNVELPLSLMATNLTLADTVDWSISNTGSNGEVIDGTLFLYVDNGFPFDANIELALYDENWSFIQNLTVVDKIIAAPVNASLRVIQKQSSRVSIPLSKSDVDNLYQAGKIIVKVAFTTIPQSQFVKIYDEYAIDIKMVGDFAYNVNPN